MDGSDEDLIEIANEAAVAGKTEEEFLLGWPLLRVALEGVSDESLAEALQRIRTSSDWPWQPESDE